MAHRILVIEDDDFLRSLTIQKLQTDGFIIDGAADGKTGLDKIKTNRFDLIILDLMLPIMSGFEILKTLRDTPDFKNLPIIVFSNMGEEKDIKMCLDLGITDYMIKSNFTLDELVEKINMVLK
jgi:DNA-binding response OmpR family regulator